MELSILEEREKVIKNNNIRTGCEGNQIRRNTLGV